MPPIIPPPVPKNNDPWLPFADPDTGKIPRNRDATPIQVCRYKPDSGGDPMQVLDNVVALVVRKRIGTDVGTARLRYRFTGRDPQAPQSVEQALSSDIVFPKTILPDDRIVIRAFNRNRQWIPFFDGFALGFSEQLDGSTEQVYIDLLGVAKVCDHQPIPGAVFRQPDKLKTSDGSADITTDVLAYFNPKGQGNCIPDSAWDKNAHGGRGYPIFIDPDNPTPAPDNPTEWSLSKAARNLIFYSQQYNIDEKILTFPTGAQIDNTLVARLPIFGLAYNKDDPNTYTTSPLTVPNKPLTGKNWTGVLHDLISGKGFTSRWKTESSDADPSSPQTTLEIFQPEDYPAKNVWLQPRGSTLDPAYSNVNSAHVGRDLVEVANEWEVQGGLTQHEISVVLTPGYPCSQSPLNTAALNALDKTNGSFNLTSKDLYRLWILDEAGEGHYQPGGNTLVSTIAGDLLDAIFGAPINNNPQYAHRRRKPKGELITVDPAGQVVKWRASIGYGYQADGQQLIKASATPGAGSYTITFRAHTTASIAYSATAATVKSSLEALSSIGTGNIKVVGTLASGFYITATGTLGNQVMDAMTVTTSGMGSVTVAASVIDTGGMAVPGLWDGTGGTWQTIGAGVQLLKDRVGIYTDTPNPNAWQVGKGSVCPSGVLKGVEAFTNPSATNRRYVIRLTCVVESDQKVKGVATRKFNSILKSNIRRTVDAHDRFAKTVVTKSSEYNPVAADFTVRDDTAAAQAEAEAIQLVTQSGVLGGKLKIPYFTLNYLPGDRIGTLQGINLSFRTDGNGADAAPTYPVVEEVTIHLDREQRVELALSDANSRRHSYTSRVRRRRDARNG